MARKRELLIKNGGAMVTVAPSIKQGSVMVPIKKGWQKINGVMVEIFDGDPAGPPYPSFVTTAVVGRDSFSSGGQPRIGYHGARRYAGTATNDTPLGYLVTASETRILSATIGRIMTSTGGGQGLPMTDTLVLMFDDRTVNADGSTKVNFGVRDLTITFIPDNGVGQAANFDVAPGAVVEASATGASFPKKFGLLSLPVSDDFMPYLANGQITIQVNTK